MFLKMKLKPLKPWQQNESRWLLGLCAIHGYENIKNLSKITGWTVPTLNAKLVAYGIAANGKGRK